MVHYDNSGLSNEELKTMDQAHFIEQNGREGEGRGGGEGGYQIYVLIEEDDGGDGGGGGRYHIYNDGGGGSDEGDCVGSGSNDKLKSVMKIVVVLVVVVLVEIPCAAGGGGGDGGELQSKEIDATVGIAGVGGFGRMRTYCWGQEATKHIEGCYREIEMVRVVIVAKFYNATGTSGLALQEMELKL
ncbi:uncharacterized protein LOC113338475 [Papaver somniferum]|uniref:uncharacterized protein LOC113338475 n=1 Tax=Papaver somniferum TaxID=3469 RepID=UPI000E6F5124|nr:uncharacterized protein LOC113338475 [Papaver somniferum]